MSSTPRDFLSDRRGAVTIIAALLATVLIGFGGLAVETGFWYAQKRQLQTQADAAALSGAYELLQGSPNAQAWAQRDAVLNGAPASAVDTSGCSGTTSCRVVVTRTQNTLLASAFLPSVTIKAAAQADVVTAPQIVTCIYALATGSGVVTLSGTASFTMRNCMLAVPNSSDSKSVNISGATTVDLGALWTHGGYNVNGSPNVTLETSAVTYAPTASIPGDPYVGNLPTIPTNLGAIQTPCTSSTNPPGGILNTVTPWNSSSGGGYWSALSVGTAKTCSHIRSVTLTPGLYFFGGGDNNTPAIDVASSVTISCPTCTCTGTSGVTIIILPSSNKEGGVSIASGATVSLCAPTRAINRSSIPAGLLIYQCDNSNSACPITTTPGPSSIPTNGSASLTGVIYLPSSTFSAPQTSGPTTQNCIILIAQSVSLSGQMSFSSSNDTCSTAGVSVGRGRGHPASQPQQVTMTQ